MDSTSLRYFIALNLINPILGARRAQQLIQHFQTPQNLFEAGESQWRSVGLSAQVIQALASPDWHGVDAALEWSASPGRQIIVLGQPLYPAQLTELYDAPIVLYVQGDGSVLGRQMLAMVGSRNPTPAGEEFTCQLAASLARLGFVVVSGMALGIDAAAHRGALSVSGQTVAVTGTGLDRIYPARHRDLASRIAEQGCLVSEFPLGSPALARHFPMRNRIISGLSRGVIVVEAALKSGSLITARQALEQNREVFAVPGSIHSPTSRGCHWLLREGAKLVENVEDILQELDFSGQQGEAAQGPNVESVRPKLPGSDYNRVLDAVDFAPTSVDLIVQRSGLTPDAVCSMLLVLELYNVVRLSDSGQYSRINGPQPADIGINESEHA